MHSDFFVIPNAWNVGEVRQLERLGFGAIATTNVALAASKGCDDLSLSRDETFGNIGRYARPPTCPLPASVFG
jgi:2-methylisocitrate lyase-like PEP mutase family enzyme